MDKNLSIAFFGEDSFSNVVLESLIKRGHHVGLVVTPWYDNLIFRRLELTCHRNGIEFLRAKKINSEEVCSKVASLSPDLGVSAHFDRIIRQPLLGIPRLGFINLHPSLLPDYRGRAPQHWPIINGEKEAGITVHYMDEDTDTGDIIVQKRFPLGEDDYVSDLQHKWLGYYKTIMVEAIDDILDGKPAQSQKDLKGSYYGKLTLGQCHIDVNGTVEQAYNLIRGVSLPYHGAWIDDCIVYRAHKIGDGYDNLPIGLNAVGNDKYILRLRDGALEIDKYCKAEIGGGYS